MDYLLQFSLGFIAGGIVVYLAISCWKKLKRLKKHNLKEYPLIDEVYREYDFPGRDDPYRINQPVTLYWSPGHTMHRVVDSWSVVHCVPAPGTNGCVLRWESEDPDKPVQF